ncbi:MAG TPA: hypothetical protein VFE51_31370 [Verrucomicrobiae bacterium]|nr:hypothetical protein [Verrucomicrobiae bacterium]
MTDLSNPAGVYFGDNQMNAVSGASPYVPTTASSTDPVVGQMRSEIKQNSQDFKALRSALNSNDLAGATQAFATLQQDIQTASQATGGKSLFDSNSPIGKDFTTLRDALKSGDISAAKQAFAAFKKDIKSAGHAARSLSHQARTDGDADDGVQTPAATATTTASATGSTLNTTA